MEEQIKEALMDRMFRIEKGSIYWNFKQERSPASSLEPRKKYLIRSFKPDRPSLPADSIFAHATISNSDPRERPKQKWVVEHSEQDHKQAPRKHPLASNSTSCYVMLPEVQTFAANHHSRAFDLFQRRNQQIHRIAAFISKRTNRGHDRLMLTRPRCVRPQPKKPTSPFRWQSLLRQQEPRVETQTESGEMSLQVSIRGESKARREARWLCNSFRVDSS